MVGLATAQEVKLNLLAHLHFAGSSQYGRPQSVRRVHFNHTKHGGGRPAGNEDVSGLSTRGHFQNLCRASYSDGARSQTHKVFELFQTATCNKCRTTHKLPYELCLSICSVMLLPAARQNLASTPSLPPQTTPKGSIHKSKPTAKSSLTTRLDWQQYMGGAKTSKADAVKRVEPDLLTWPYADLQIGNELPGKLAATMFPDTDYLRSILDKLFMPGSSTVHSLLMVLLAAQLICQV